MVIGSIFEHLMKPIQQSKLDSKSRIVGDSHHHIFGLKMTLGLHHRSTEREESTEGATFVMSLGQGRGLVAIGKIIQDCQ